MLMRSIRSFGGIFLFISLVIVVGTGGCAHGRFVGTSYVPTKAYAGDERPDVELASIGSGIHMGEKSGSSVFIDGLVWSALLLSVDGQSCSGSIAQVLPGSHTFSVSLRSSLLTDGTRLRWKQSKPFDVIAEVEKGVAYNLMPAKKANGAPGATLKKLCVSSDHIDTIKSFQQYGEMSCK
jgi:hypothetical protein